GVGNLRGPGKPGRECNPGRRGPQPQSAEPPRAHAAALSLLSAGELTRMQPGSSPGVNPGSFGVADAPEPDVRLPGLDVALARGGPLVPVAALLRRVLVGELALPDVAPPHPAGARQLVAPGVLLADQPAAGGELPLRLRRQPLAGPLAVRLGVEPADVNDRVVLAAGDAAAGALGVPPVRPGHPLPPP